MVITGVSTLFLFVKNLRRSIDFYKDTLGIPVAREGEQDARFEIDGFNVVIHEDLTQDEFQKWKINPKPGERGWGSILTLRSDNVDAEYKRLKELDVCFICEPMSMPWGTRMFLLQDPDGYVMEISKPIEGAHPDH